MFDSSREERKDVSLACAFSWVYFCLRQETLAGVDQNPFAD